MITIKNSVKNEIIIKNSKFICHLIKIENINDVDKELKNLRKEYKDATHICWAYKFDNKQKYSDDGEPGGTAGAPIMDVIIKNNITNILAVVIRYFGGIKLGSGGLIRAYSKSVREALNKTEKEEIIFYNIYELKSNYDDLKLLNNLTKNLEIIKKDFSNDITYEIKLEKSKDNIPKIFKNTNIKIKKLD